MGSINVQGPRRSLRSCFCQAKGQVAGLSRLHLLPSTWWAPATVGGEDGTAKRAVAPQGDRETGTCTQGAGCGCSRAGRVCTQMEGSGEEVRARPARLPVRPVFCESLGTAQELGPAPDRPCPCRAASAFVNWDEDRAAAWSGRRQETHGLAHAGMPLSAVSAERYSG